MARRIPIALAVSIVLAFAATASIAHASTTFNPVADTYVDASSPASSYGSQAYVRTDASPVRTAYLRFNVQGVTDFSSARLRLYIESSSNLGFEIRSVSNNTWSETMTASNAPAVGPVVWSSGSVNGGTWVYANVSSLVTGNGPVSFALTSPDTTAIKFTSREGANRPELIVPAPVPTSQFAVSRNGSTYQASSVPAGTTYSGSLKSVVESAAVELNGSGGGTVTFGAGTFDYGSDYFDVNQIHDITFAGQGMDVTFIQNSSSASGDTEPFNFSGAFNVVIRDMTISAGGPPRTTSDVIDFDQGNDSLVERVKITASRGRGIVFDGKDAGWDSLNNVVRDCVITNVPGDGIELLGSSSNRIEGCTISSTGFHGIQVTKSSNGGSQPNKKSNDNVITGNTIDNAGQDGVNVNSSDRNRIAGNTVTNSANITATRDGIRVSSADAITCNDNIVESNSATDNQPVKTQGYGLNISSALCNRTIVTDNTFTGNKTGEIKNLGTGTVISSNDTQEPTAPTNLAATSVAPFSVGLSWTASTDNVGVTGYTVYRNSQFLAIVGGTTLTYQDTTVVPNTSYAYTVDAFDAATNHSPVSNVVNVTTPAQPSSLTLNPVADSYVKSDTPGSNYGTSTQVRVDASPDTRSYLRFAVSGVSGTITSAKLRIYANSSSNVGHDVRGVTDTTWGEGTITYTNAPAVGGVVGSSGPFSSGAYIEVDVTSLITGNGTYSFAVTTPSNTAISYASDESANRPELVLNLGP